MASSRALRVQVVGDRRVHAEALAEALSSGPVQARASTVPSLADAASVVVAEEVDVLVLDAARIDGDSSVDLRRVVAELVSLDVSVVVLSDDGSERDSAMIVPPDRALREVLVVVHELGRGAGRDGAAAKTRSRSFLTGREHEILVHLAEGLTPHDIARILSISVHTCRGHVKNLLTKLGAHSQLEAVVTAARRGLLDGHPLAEDRGQEPD